MSDDHAILLEDVRCFDDLLDTVPFRYILPSGADASLQSEAREQEKRLDPRTVKSTSQKLREWLATQRPQGKKAKAKGGGKGQATSREDLQKKLHSRIDELREKRKLEQSQRDKAAAAARDAREGKPKQAQPQIDFGAVGVNARKSELTTAELNPNAAGSKKRKLQQQLREEEQQRAKLQKMAPDERDTAKREIGMKKAMQRAQGERVHDNTTKIRKALKTMETKKSKSKKDWEARQSHVRQQGDERQERRQENLKNKRTRGKKDVNTETRKTRKDEQGGPKGQPGKDAAGKGAAGKGAPKGGKGKSGPQSGGRKEGRAGFEGKRKGFLNSE